MTENGIDSCKVNLLGPRLDVKLLNRVSSCGFVPEHGRPQAGCTNLYCPLDKKCLIDRSAPAINVGRDRVAPPT
jgi:hypothetical protein